MVLGHEDLNEGGSNWMREKRRAIVSGAAEGPKGPCWRGTGKTKK